MFKALAALKLPPPGLPFQNCWRRPSTSPCASVTVTSGNDGHCGHGVGMGYLLTRRICSLQICHVQSWSLCGRTFQGIEGGANGANAKASMSPCLSFSLCSSLSPVPIGLQHQFHPWQMSHMCLTLQVPSQVASKAPKVCFQCSSPLWYVSCSTVQSNPTHGGPLEFLPAKPCFARQNSTILTFLRIPYIESAIRALLLTGLPVKSLALPAVPMATHPRCAKRLPGIKKIRKKILKKKKNDRDGLRWIQIDSDGLRWIQVDSDGWWARPTPYRSYRPYTPEALQPSHQNCVGRSSPRPHSSRRA